MNNDSLLIKSKENRILSSDAILILIFFSLLSFVSVIISISLLPIENDIFSNIFYLPLGTGILYVLSMFYVKSFRNNVINIIIYLLYFVRNSLAIYFLNEANFNSIMPIYSQSQVNKAVLLMLLETVMVFIVIGKFGRRSSDKIKDISLDISKNFKLVIFIFFTVSALIYIIDPTTRSLYTSIFSGDITAVKSYTDIIGGESLYYRIFRQLYPIVQLFTPLLVINYSRIKFKQTTVGVIISLISSFFPLLFVSSQSAYAVVITITLLLTIIKLYPKFQKILFQIIGFLGIVILSFFIYQKIQGSNYTDSTFSTSSFFQSYFPGVTNVSAAFLIPRNYVTNETILNELITFLPLRQYLVTDWDFLNRSIHLFQDVIQNPYQIMSNTSIGYLYFGYFGPLLSVILIWIANIFYIKKSDNIIMYGTNLFVSLFFAVGPIMLNIVNVGARFVETFILLLLLAYFSDIKNINKMFKIK